MLNPDEKTLEKLRENNRITELQEIVSKSLVEALNKNHHGIPINLSQGRPISKEDVEQILKNNNIPISETIEIDNETIQYTYKLIAEKINIDNNL